MPFNNPLFSTHISPFLASTFLCSFVRYRLCLRQHFFPILQFIHMVLLLSSNQYNHFPYICRLLVACSRPLISSLEMCMKIMCRGLIHHLRKVVWVPTLCAHKILGEKMCVDLQASSFEWTISFVCLTSFFLYFSSNNFQSPQVKQNNGINYSMFIEFW